MDIWLTSLTLCPLASCQETLCRNRKLVKANRTKRCRFVWWLSTHAQHTALTYNMPNDKTSKTLPYAFFNILGAFRDLQCMENAPFETNMFSSQALIEWCWCPLDAWPDLASLRPKLIQPPPAAQKFTASLFSLSAARSSWSGGDLGFRPTSKNPTACGWEARKFWCNGYQCDGIAFCIEPQSLLGPCSEFSLVNNPSFWYCCVG